MSIHRYLTGKETAEERAKEFEARLTAIADSVAGRFARGNVALQQGYVVTRDQLDREREELRDYQAAR